MPRWRNPVQRMQDGGKSDVRAKLWIAALHSRGNGGLGGRVAATGMVATLPAA